MSSPLIVTGTPRSGTVYAQAFLQLMGLNVGHEEWKNDGIVSWTAWCPEEVGDLWRKDMPLHPTETRLVHLVRHPLSVLKSLCTLQERSWDLVEAVCPGLKHYTGLKKEIRFWMRWNSEIEKVAVARVRVEDLDPPNLLGISKNVNTREKRKNYRDQVTAQEVRFALGEMGWHYFDRQARRYGYELGISLGG